MTPEELLELATDELALRDHDVLAKAVAEVLAQRPREGQLLDFKSGEGTRSEKRNPIEVRRDVSSFANADGGVILYGVPEEEDPRGGKRAGNEPDGIHDDRSPFEDWLESAMRNLLPELVPFPRPRRVTIGTKEVVILPIRRADRLVPCREKGNRTSYYLRAGDGKFEVPPYLHADLVLGRRERPSLVLGVAQSHARGDQHEARVEFCATVASTGAVWVPGLVVGAVGYFSSNHPRSPRPLAPTLREYVDLSKDLPTDVANSCRVEFFPSPPIQEPLPPFGDVSVPFSWPLPVPKGVSAAVGWQGAIVAIPSNGPPQWSAVEVRFKIRLANEASVMLCGEPEVRPMSGAERPPIWYGLAD